MGGMSSGWNAAPFRSPEAPLRFAVIQLGARMHYAVPALLKRAGRLAHFYTDVVGNLGFSEILGGLLPPRLRSPSVRRLLSRRAPEELPRDVVTTVEDVAFFDAILKRLPHGAVWRDRAPEQLRRRMLLDDFHNANALYCLDPGDIELIRAAKRRGMRVVYEQNIAPQVGRILRDERARYPGFERQDPEKVVEDGLEVDREIWRLADLVVVPSEFVRSGLLELGARSDNIALVPYGLADSWYAPVETRPTEGRVLFVGGVGLRKGNHYLAEACRILTSRGVNAQFRVVGPFDPNETMAAPFLGPTYVGTVPRDDVRAEFLQADVFAFPTLAEGFALAHLEAMACGLPVVTTPNCGPAVRDGQDGFVIPPRDPVALADRLQLIISDRGLRERMSESARLRAAEFSWRAYQDRLIGALATLEGRGPGRSTSLAA